MIEPETPLDLEVLAPHVDQRAAKEVFHRRRKRRQARQVVAASSIGLAVSVAVVAGMLLPKPDDVAVHADHGSEEPPTATKSADEATTSEAEVPFDVIAELAPDSSRAGTKPISATNDSELKYLWHVLRQDPSDMPDIDLDRAIALAVTVPSTGCPRELNHLMVVQAYPIDEIHALTSPTDKGCDQPPATWTTVVTIERSMLPPQFTLVVPAPAESGYDDAPLGVVVAPADQMFSDDGWTDQPHPGSDLSVVNVATDDTLMFRSGPGTDFPVEWEARSIESGYVATGRNRLVDGQTWAEVTSGDRLGWASTRYLVQLSSSEDVTSQHYPDPAGRPAAASVEDLARSVVAAMFGAVNGFQSTVVYGPVVDDAGYVTDITVDVRYSGDDTGSGSRIQIQATQPTDGEFVLRSITESAHCTRGVSGGLCI